MLKGTLDNDHQQQNVPSSEALHAVCCYALSIVGGLCFEVLFVVDLPFEQRPFSMYGTADL